jgi:hypothetical protein
MVRLEGLGKLKNPPHPELELATFHLVIQNLSLSHFPMHEQQPNTGMYEHNEEDKI